MKVTGIVRRVDDLKQIVSPKDYASSLYQRRLYLADNDEID